MIATSSQGVRVLQAVVPCGMILGLAYAGGESAEADRWGELTGRVRSISMHRDYTEVGLGSGTNTAVGLHLSYETPSFGHLSGGLAYDLVEEIHRNGRSMINLNDDIQLLTEAWMRMDLVEDWTLTAGRQVANGEVFREDVFRHKSRAIEAMVLGFDDAEGLQVTAGHAIRLSNWLQFRNYGEFNGFGDVFGDPKLETDGLTWLEATHSGFRDWEFGVFAAYAHEVALLAGGRFRWQCSERYGFSGFYRHEQGDWHSRGNAEAFGIAVDRKLGPVDLELGTFSVRGHPLLFQALTTGLNHPLGALMLICESPFDDGADSVYLKAVCRLDSTMLYGLYAFTAHGNLLFDGHELNLVVSHDLDEAWNIALKFGYGLRHPNGGGNEQLSDSRLIVTWRL